MLDLEAPGDYPREETIASGIPMMILHLDSAR
jgi:hypothetical protein